ncbi:MAG: class I SAM-dependent methyltransferase [Candidatus Gastranaerophilales bacterium]|nr:class I SAM-dependent methyltransferase [Candidatus Gastranaerophilales bacterium]
MTFIHPNCSLKNWLVYKQAQSFLYKFKNRYGKVLYDLGCGEMPYKDFFLQFCNEYVGIDWSGTLHKLKADIVADLNKPLPIEPEVADTVISLSVLEHLYEPQMMINEAWRILKPGGNIILQVPWQWSVHEAPHDYFRYTPYGLECLFKKAGFKNILVEPTAGFFTMWFLKFNYFSTRIIKGPKPFRYIIKAFLIPTWFMLQCVAPILDKLDRNWLLEAPGYWVTAKK